MSTPDNYENIDPPYNTLLERNVQNIGNTSPIGTQNSSAQSSAGSTPIGVTGSAGANVGTAIPSASVEPMAVKSDGSFGDVWIKSFIRSENWKPKKNGFNIDGGSGYAEFTKVFISGEVHALSGIIGGFNIGDTSLSVTDDGNTTGLSTDAMVFFAGPTGAPTVSITKTGELNASAGHIGGWTVENTYIKDESGAVGMASNVTTEDDVRFWAGNTDPAVAPFRVTESGFLAAEYGVIGGFTITAQELYGGIIKTNLSVGSVGTNGVIIDTAGLRGYSAILGQVFNISTNGDRPTFSNGVILVSNMYSSNIAGGTIVGGIVTGSLIRTAAEGRRIEITSTGMQAINGALGVSYGDSSNRYGDATRFYGTGVLVYFNNNDVEIPFYVNQEQTVADIHLYNRSTEPSGKAGIGDIAVVNNKLMMCMNAGTPGTWQVVGAQTA